MIAQDFITFVVIYFVIPVCYIVICPQGSGASGTGTLDFKWLKDFLGSNIWEVFFGVLKTICTLVVVPAYPGHIVLQINYNQTYFATVLIFCALFCICFIN